MSCISMAYEHVCIHQVRGSIGVQELASGDRLGDNLLWRIWIWQLYDGLLYLSAINPLVHIIADCVSYHNKQFNVIHVIDFYAR